MKLDDGIAVRLGRLFRESQAAEVGARAVERGLLTPEQLDSAMDAAEDQGQPLQAVLEHRGWLDALRFGALEAELGREGFTRPSLGARGELPPEAEAAARDPERRQGRFILTKVLGRGGTGDVWRAWDPRLRRWVAVKLAAAALESTTARERFEREALAAGRLSHPQIVPIHEVNVAHGRAYIVMPLVEGQTLVEAALPLPAAIEAVRQVALALEHAHRHGLVHRDVKPANIMIDAEGRPYLLDFGIAHIAESSLATMTRPGDVLGTASYLSPEAARGGPAGRAPATDIYGLGATLYHLATGRPPFTGDSFAAIVNQVLAAEPMPPRKVNPAVDRRLEQVIQRAMEKDVRLRHPTAAALAADLQRVLAGQPMAGGTRASVRRWFSRRGSPVLWTAVLAVAGTVAASFMMVASRERRSTVQAFRQAALASLESGLRLRRAGDMVGMRNVLDQIIASAETAQPALAQVAEVHYLVGRIHRAQMNEERALTHQERALAISRDFPPALYERAVLNARRYGRILQRAKARRGLDRVPIPPDELDALDGELAPLRQAILRDGRRLGQLRLGDVDAAAVRGLLMYHGGSHAEAEGLLRDVVARDPWREEAWETLALSLQDGQRMEEAEAVYDAALMRDAGYPPFWVGRCRARTARGKRLLAIADAQKAAALVPELASAHYCAGNARLHEGMFRATHGEDPSGLWEAAREDFDRAIREDPQAANSYGGRGTLSRYRATYLLRHGEDPSAELDAGVADLTRGLSLEPTNFLIQASRGRALATRALALLRSGADPGRALDAALADYDGALARRKSRAALEWRADLATLRASWLASRAEAPAAAIAAAEGDFAQLTAAGEQEPWIFIHRAKLRALQGQLANGPEASRWLEEAERDLSQALAKDDRLVEAWCRRASVRRARAEEARGRNERRRWWSAARGDVARALALDPHDVDAVAEARAQQGR